MGFCRNFQVILISTILISVSLSAVETMAMRPLGGGEFQWLDRKSLLIVQSLQKGPVPPAGRNPCTFIPGRGRGRCALSEMNFAVGDHDHVDHAPPVFPDRLIAKFGIQNRHWEVVDDDALCHLQIQSVAAEDCEFDLDSVLVEGCKSDVNFLLQRCHRCPNGLHLPFVAVKMVTAATAACHRSSGKPDALIPADVISFVESDYR
ncbi:hypothetical protein Dsin_024121 [Dipteronia sinensis]|uniref:Uncharacterized protein n=1 Tax=Dipteronia sinensis TaxID=43782 RepID=A0AAE0A671_9ROSI|nr:hypothetical protein Dsin_024121 [Dipteronia sinensis]